MGSLYMYYTHRTNFKHSQIIIILLLQQWVVYISSRAILFFLALLMLMHTGFMYRDFLIALKVQCMSGGHIHGHNKL